MRVQYKQLENKQQRTYREVGGGTGVDEEGGLWYGGAVSRVFVWPGGRKPEKCLGLWRSLMAFLIRNPGMFVQ